MYAYAEQLPDAIGDYIGQDKAVKLAAELKSAYNVEQLLFELERLENRDERLAVLDKAAGNFEAAADTILAGK
jgi:hypothetical protein